jgi:hypothetical protein
MARKKLPQRHGSAGSGILRSVTRTGRCYCGAVQYRLEGALGPLVNCHCRDCRRAHGAAFATAAVVRSGDLHLTAGESLLKEYRTGGGARYLCERCGGRLFNRPASNPELTMLLVASLDDEPETGPVMHVNVESKAPWYEIRDDLPRFDGLPPQAAAALER